MHDNLKPGSRVKLVHDDGTVLVGVVNDEYPTHLNTLLATTRIDYLLDNGFRVTHIDGEPVPAAPILPTEPGVYVDKDGEAWQLFEDGGWMNVTGTESPEGFAPFTRLVPEGENRAAIAREVIDWINDHVIDPDGWESAVWAANQRFGVEREERGS